MNKQKKTQRTTPKSNNVTVAQLTAAFAKLKPKGQAKRPPIKAPRMKLSTDDARYKAALDSPFSTQAQGSQVPFLCSTGTKTAKLREVLSFTNGTGGSFQGIFLPSPVVTFFLQGNVGGAGPTPTGFGNSWTSGGYAAGMVTDSIIQGTFAQVRVVAGGIRIRNIANMNTVQGRIICVPLPIPSGVVPNTTLLQGSASVSTISTAFAANLGAATSTPAWLTTGFLCLPGAFEVAADQLVGRDLELPFRPMDYQAFDMHSTSSIEVGDGTNVMAEENDIVNIASGTISSSGTYESNKCAEGWNAWAVYYYGGASGASTLDCEVVLHLEGTPSSSSTGAIGQTAVRPHATYFTADAALQYVQNLDMGRLAEPILKFYSTYRGLSSRYGHLLMGNNNRRRIRDEF